MTLPLSSPASSEAVARMVSRRRAQLREQRAALFDEAWWDASRGYNEYDCNGARMLAAVIVLTLAGYALGGWWLLSR